MAFYSNGGVSTDLSLAVMERTLLHTDNCYYLPHVELTGQVCFTNLPSNTAFRGFGGPQAMVVIENILESIAETDWPRCVRRADAESVRRRRAKHHAVRPGVRQQPFAGDFRDARGPLAVSQAARRGGPLQRRVANARSRPGDDRREVRHLVHDEVSQPGQRARECLHGRHGAGFDRRDRDGAGRQRENPAARGR